MIAPRNSTSSSSSTSQCQHRHRQRRGGPLRPAAWLGIALWASHAHGLVSSSIHELHGRTTGARFTERMFADGHGPLGLGGRSTIAVHALVEPLGDADVHDDITVHKLREYFDLGLVVAIYTEPDDGADAGIDAQTLCRQNFTALNDEGRVQGAFYAVDDVTHAPSLSSSSADSATTMTPMTTPTTTPAVEVAIEFHPRQSGLQVVALIPCWRQKDEAFGYPVRSDVFSVYPMKDPLFAIDATVAFENPYGYLPALLYGLFPFSGVLSLLYGFVDVCFLVLINRHRRQALRVQYMLLVVLLLATGESLAWYFTYDLLNRTGQRVCCPYPGLVLLSTMLKIIAGMVARVATTLVCLGYGVVRPTITAPEVLVVVGLGICYFVSVGALEISHIVNQSNGEATPPAIWEILVVATNVCFVGWIFTSLALTRKNLALFGQTAKLRMYTALARVLVTYVLASFFLMGLEGAVYAGSIDLPWQYIWLVWAANRLLMFGILVGILVIWRPQATSQLYAHMDQIPTHELPATPSSSEDPRHHHHHSRRGALELRPLPPVPCAQDELTPRPLKPTFGADGDDVHDEPEPDRPPSATTGAADTHAL